VTIVGLSDSADSAAQLFCTFSEGRPELTPLGIPAVDNAIGGMFKGSLVVVGLATGVGKSRFMLGSALNYGEVCKKAGSRVGVISLEDGEDVVGSRLLAWASGVNSRKIRTKTFDKDELALLQDGREYLSALDEAGSSPMFAYRIGGSLDDILKAVDELADAGCEVIWLDYLQKVRGVSEDRRGEVGLVMSSFQRACSRRGAVPALLSQFSRGVRNEKHGPQIHYLKESGDIENEGRLIILGWRADSLGEGVIGFKIAKSTFGATGLKFYMKTGESGMLEPWSIDDE